MSKIDEKKKEEEKKILKSVFSEQDFIIKGNEPLDFILSSVSHTFGVEITRLYYNDGFGRLSNQHDYVSSVRNNNGMHKDDYLNLKIRSCYIQLPSDEQFHFLFNKIMYEKPTKEEFTNMIVARIKSKNSKAKQYNRNNVEWLELLISDENGFFRDNYNLDNNLKDLIIKEVEKSIFKTVYILTRGSDKNSLIVVGEMPDFLNVN